MHEKIEFMGLLFDSVSMSEAIEQCMQWCMDEGPSRTLMTINAALLMMMRNDSDLNQAVSAGDLVVADGLSVVWGTRFVGTPLIGRVAGIDLMQNLLNVSNERKLRVFFLGAKQHVIDDMIQLCVGKYSNLVIAGSRNGYFNESDHTDVVQRVRESNADILFLGMPSPFKEIWGERYRNALNVSVIIGVGGSFDVIAGHVKRAPRWMQCSGMEWFWRLIMEPRKLWRRYLVYNSAFIYRLGIEIFNKRFSPDSK